MRPLYNSCSLPIQVMTTGPSSAHSKGKSGLPRITGKCPGGRWQILGVAAGLGAGPQVQREPGLASEGVLRLRTLLSLTPSSPDLNPLDYFAWSYVENITNMTSYNTKASLIAAIPRVFAELPPVLVEKACSQFRICIEVVTEAEGGYTE